MRVIALVPARDGSQGIPDKNFRILNGRSPLLRACQIGLDAGCEVVVSTDRQYVKMREWDGAVRYLHRPAELATDTAAMYDVVKHAATSLLLEPDDRIVLLQPTQPLRTVKYVQWALDLLTETGADSVVSVVPLPDARLCQILDGRLYAVGDQDRRQDAPERYRRDGTVYAFPVRTLDSGTIYGTDCRPLLIDPSETCSLDTPLEWTLAELRVPHLEPIHVSLRA